ncbi:MAG: ROK family protein, partial [Acidobacteria bacterium]|nr:ROK family protein [Acidobacteriota bacterium]
GPPCYCGRRGCIETFLSGPGLERDYAEHAALPPSRLRRFGEPRRSVRGGGKASRDEDRHDSGPTVDAIAIAERARAGEARAVACLARYEERMARALASIINVLDPDVIVLGGGLSKIDRLYDNVPNLWAPYVFSDHIVTKLVRAKHGDASGVRGAAWLWNG